MPSIDVTKQTKIVMPKLQKWLLLGLVFLLLFLGTSAYFFRRNLYKELIKPTIPFQIANKPSVPNYADESAWLKRGTPISTNTDVFFINPTAYYNGKLGWNANIAEDNLTTRLRQVVLPNHAAPFETQNNMWIPKYRQATLYAMLSQSEDSRDALDLAYSDIEKAFDVFLAARNPNAKFTIVGINQGGLHALRLLQSRVAKTPLEPNLLAAYIIDQAVPASLFSTALPANMGKLQTCISPKQVNCVFAFADFDENDAKAHEIFSLRSSVWQNNIGYLRLDGKATLCANPLNGGSSPAARAIANLGSVSANNLEEGTRPALLPGVTGARCENGLLLVDPSRPANLRPRRFELGTLHKTPEYNLFYQALSNDFQTRSKQ
ncbi:MAG: DUF3089 domain-containing protein [Pseudomonadota bacterium]